ncbi:MAG TPA: glycosyltransferase family 2 protein, partial [Myxococcota bacterium]|nr:glycosyltransferase family 2 protein [Myxococcota bacterium]
MESRSAQPRLSVLLPVHQAERYLEEAIESVLAQSFDDFELLALDDGSTDGSARILEALAERDARIRVWRSEHAGLVAQLNRGLAAARGEYIARMDADDVSHPERFERQVAYLDAHPECVALGTGTDEVDPERRIIRTLDVRTEHHAIEACLLQGDGGALIHASAVYRAHALRRIGGYRKQFEFGEVIDLHLRLAEIGRLANLRDRLYEYRQNPASVCFTRASEVRGNQDAAIQDALRRRGASPASAPARPAHAPTRSLDEVWALWAHRAQVAGNRDTARHYALAAL